MTESAAWDVIKQRKTRTDRFQAVDVPQFVASEKPSSGAAAVAIQEHKQTRTRSVPITEQDDDKETEESRFVVMDEEQQTRDTSVATTEKQSPTISYPRSPSHSISRELNQKAEEKEKMALYRI